MKSLQKERAGSSNSRPLKVSHKIKPHITTRVRITQVEIETESPRCGHCGEPMNLVPFHVGGSDLPVYRWVCGNKNGEGDCLAYPLFGDQVIEVPGEVKKS